MSNRNNYTAKMTLKKQNRSAAGLVSERFPYVSDIIIHMTYYQKGPNPVLMLRTVNVFPSSYAYFKMDCMIKDCDGGGFDLTPVIAEMVKTHKKVKKGSLVCHGKTDYHSHEHASIDYDIMIKYNKKSERHRDKLHI
ncbi:hypothetical protein JZK55_02970 [Dissulfurispira thermophila]|uniref:Uncharacterized protein n=2 Tax=root TaxID=1 RepID=A0A7G1GY71_9BACT|nr:hypothetical protein [Dissulfurispira thermophila]BCB95375.1 hypothetical protein JZK55_02970 [Dissulfurispira thermophila]